MASAYTLYFSDPRKTGTITVPGTGVGSGKNNYDTSLELVGPGYVNYGSAIAQNFLKLLESFSGPNPPQNPIEGQVWYDTSNTGRKILRVHNASPTSRGWPTVSGIYQQTSDPAISTDSLDPNTSVKDGDLWANLAKGQLNLRSGGQWIVVGPSTVAGAQRTGYEVTTVTSSLNVSYPIIQNYINGDVVEIISFNEFIPRTVINGFTTIKVGSNLTSRNGARYNGTADRALALEAGGVVVQSTELLKNRATSQTHTGTFIVESADGLKVQNPSYNYSLQLTNGPQGGILNFDGATSTFRAGINLASYLNFNSQFRNIGINTATTSLSPTLDVYGSGGFRGLLTVRNAGTTALSVEGNSSIQGTLSIQGNATISSQATVSNKVIVGGPGATVLEPTASGVYDLGSSVMRFRQIYASDIGDSLSRINGTLQGAAQRLETPRQFSISGQVSALGGSFDGTGNINFAASVTPQAISAQPTAALTTGSQTFLVLNTGTVTPVLEKISKTSLLSDVYPGLLYPGMIVPTGISNSVLMPGFLLCDGTAYSRTTYSALFAAIGTSYGTSPAGTFRVPNLTGVTITTGGQPVYYYIKI